MPRICYQEQNLQDGSVRLINQANVIINEYIEEGYRLTIRQLYYQFVSKDLIENTVSAYGRIVDIVKKGRLGGYIDWDAIEDRTRNLRELDHWDDAYDIISDAAEWFRIDKWKSQDYRLEVWVEKEALAGILLPVCQKYDVPFFACKGYNSLSEMWVAGQRIDDYIRDGQTPVIIHLGDHDPSGVDMTRDIKERLELFADKKVTVERIALNMDQIDEYEPPPNPAKTTDSRFKTYMLEYGTDSWELDALSPKVLDNLVSKTIGKYIDVFEWDACITEEERERERLENMSWEKYGKEE